MPFPKAKKELKDIVYDLDKIILTEKEIKDVNAGLAKMAADIQSIEKRFIALQQTYTIHDIIDEYKAGLSYTNKQKLGC